MNNIRPGQIAVLAGGVLIFVSSFMDWVAGSRTGWNAYDGDIFGFTGILLLLIALDLIVTTALRAFAPQVRLPDQVLGFSMNELLLMGGFAATVWGISIATSEGAEGGPVLCFVGGLIAVGGAVMEIRAEGAPTASEPPRTI